MTVKVDFITHEEATIRSFMCGPKYADYYLHEVLADGDAEEIQQLQSWYNEAKSRTASMGYWSSLVDNAEQTARDGKNLDVVIALMNRELDILKAAVPAGA